MKGYCSSCRLEQPMPMRPKQTPRCRMCGDRLGLPPKKRKPLLRKVPLERVELRNPGIQESRKSRRPPRRGQPGRIWVWARLKVEDEAACRFCGEEFPPKLLSSCHVIGRDRDEFDPVTREPRPQPWVVDPDRIVPGCPDCHLDYDEHRIDLLGKLTLEEELQAVVDCRFLNHSGIENARLRTAPLMYGSKAA